MSLCHKSDSVSALLLTLLSVPPLLLTRIASLSFCYYTFLDCLTPVLVVLVPVLTLLQPGPTQRLWTSKDAASCCSMMHNAAKC